MKGGVLLVTRFPRVDGSKTGNAQIIKHAWQTSDTCNHLVHASHAYGPWRRSDGYTFESCVRDGTSSMGCS